MKFRNVLLSALNEDNEEDARRQAAAEEEQERQRQQQQQQAQQAQGQQTPQPQANPNNPQAAQQQQPNPNAVAQQPQPAANPNAAAGADPNAAAGGDMPTMDDMGMDDDPTGMGDMGLDDAGGGSDPNDPANQPAPDGLPEADDAGTGEEKMETEDGETNLQVNVMQLSKLDRTLAKREVLQNFMDLRSKINRVQNLIDKNEVNILQSVRDSAVTRLDGLLNSTNSYLKYKFPIVNFEEAMTTLFIFIKELNAISEYVRTEGVGKTEEDAKKVKKNKQEKEDTTSQVENKDSSSTSQPITQ